MVTRNRNLEQRPNWFDRQFVRAQDFVDADDYQLDRRRRHLRLLHTPGVAEGLRVIGSVGDATVTVSGGTAIDAHGREIVLMGEREGIQLPKTPTKAEIYLLYQEALTEASRDPGVDGHTRIREIAQFAVRGLEPQLDPVPTSPADPGNVPGILLAEIQISGGTLAAEPNNGVRTLAGATMGELTAPSLTLRRTDVPRSQWPRIATHDTDGGIRFLTGNTPQDERMRITSGGKVAIGTQAPIDAALTLASSAVPVGLRQTGQPADAGGLWRLRLDAGALHIDVNKAPAGDFSTFATPLAMDRVSPHGPGVPMVTIGSGGNGALSTRHIDGKSHLNDDPDGLYLNWATGKPVLVGNDGAPTTFHTHGEIESRRFPADDQTQALAALSLTGRSAGGGAHTWKLYTASVGGGFGVEPRAFEIWQYPETVRRFQIRPNGDTILTPSGGTIGMPGGAVISASGRLHVAGDEILYLLNKNGVTIGREWGGTGSLHAQGDVSVDGDVAVAGRIGSLGLHPTNGIPPGWAGGLHTFDVYAEGSIGCGRNGALAVSMDAGGGVSARIKQFVIDHPLDPDHSLLRHGVVEGPEHAVYYRGEGRLVDGWAEVELPAYFEALTRAQGRTVQLTPRFGGDEALSPLAASAVTGGRFRVRTVDGVQAGHGFYWEVRAVRADVPLLQTEIAKPAATPVPMAEPAEAGAW